MGSSYITSLAITTVLLYASLSIACIYYFIIFSKRRRNPALRGRYDDSKILFFGALALSSAFDIPMFLGCALENGPTDCEWDSISYPVFWSFHLFALCGYALCLGIPTILWSDIINQKDGKIINSRYPLDFIKSFFRVALAIYFTVDMVTILAIIAQFRPSDHNKFVQDSVMYVICTITEPVIILGISVACLYSGIRLQMHVLKVQLHGNYMFNFLISLNFVMVLMTTTYLLRAILVVTLILKAFDLPAFHVDYTAWLILTRWLPHIFCSFFLLRVMKQTQNDQTSSEKGYVFNILGIFYRNDNQPQVAGSDFHSYSRYALIANGQDEGEDDDSTEIRSRLSSKDSVGDLANNNIHNRQLPSDRSSDQYSFGSSEAYRQRWLSSFRAGSVESLSHAWIVPEHTTMNPFLGLSSNSNSNSMNSMSNMSNMSNRSNVSLDTPSTGPSSVDMRRSSETHSGLIDIIP